MPCKSRLLNKKNGLVRLQIKRHFDQSMPETCAPPDCETILRAPSFYRTNDSCNPLESCGTISNCSPPGSAQAWSRLLIACRRFNGKARRAFPFSSPDWTAPGTSPNATARQNCNSHATEPPARSGMHTRHSRPQAKSFGNSPRHRTAFDFFASQPNFRKAGAASALLVRAMPSRWDAKSPMQKISYMQTGSTSQAKALSIRSEFLVESASGPTVLNARSRRSRAD
ncbi:hypothetical protein ACVII1_007298 [Bradyrhizobium elkanii]